MAFICVNTEEIKQWFQAIFVTKHIWREVAVEKLHTIPNRRWASWTWKWCIKWLKVQLQHKIIITPITEYNTNNYYNKLRELISYNNKSYAVDFLLSFYKFFFETEIFRNTQLLHTEFKDINTDIFPNTWSGTNCYGHKRRQNYGFLSQK